ncbi:MAG: galactose mutarotase [Spirochaetaceae bacterium]|nr:MAG: galactose mutarotase [Spirochaetaceae bacterium]
MRERTNESFGVLPGDGAIPLIRLSDGGGSGATLAVMPYGAAMVDLRVPDREGHPGPVILRYDTLDEYVQGTIYSGAIVGRIAGRLTGGRFVLDGREYRLERNNPPNHLHGGNGGFYRRVWTVTGQSDDSVTMHYHSPAGEEGYPGSIDVEVEYRLGSAAWLPPGHDPAPVPASEKVTAPAPASAPASAAPVDLIIRTRARTDAPTPLSTTSHAHFNLSGGGEQNVDSHRLAVYADHYTPTDDTMTLLGRVEPVEGTAADLRKPRLLGEVIPALHQRHGDNYLLRDVSREAAIRHVARAEHPASGRVMDTFTDASCLQFFGGDGLTAPFARRAGFCLECQGYPDGPNHPEIDDIILRPGELYSQTIVYRFRVTAS